MEVSINCLMDGRPSSEVITIRISSSDNIYCLKKAIRNEYELLRERVPAYKLELLKNDDNKPQAKPLDALSSISDCFQLPLSSQNIHVIVVKTDETILVKRCSLDAVLPLRMTDGAAGYDLFSVLDVYIQPGQVVSVSTGISISIPRGCYGRIAGRSSLALYHYITVLAGVIDNDCTGTICVVLCNLGKNQYQVQRGNRIAQLLIENNSTPDIKEVKNLSITVRGGGVFGSTGY